MVSCLLPNRGFSLFVVPIRAWKFIGRKQASVDRRGGPMALEIAATPILEGQEAIDFLEKIEREKHEKVPLASTSGFAEFLAKMIEDVTSRKR
jgi:hypothetical protein